MVGPIWASWSFLASISALFRAGRLAGSIFSSPILTMFQEPSSGWKGSRAMLDMVSLSFRVTALKYLFKRPCSGFDEQAVDGEERDQKTDHDQCPVTHRTSFLDCSDTSLSES